MRQFFGARLLEAVDVAALWVDARQEVADRAVLTGGVHALKNQELNAIGVGSIESLKELIPAAQFEETQRYLTRYNPILGISPAPDDTGDG